MRTSRRNLLRVFSGVASLLLLNNARAQDATSQRPGPLRPGEDDANLPNKPSTKTILEDNQKDIKKNIEKLFDLASQLKDQVEKTDSTSVLSLALVKKAEEIEKLARQIKERAKG
ncbi:MAG TPA: hypothetical protein VLC94_03950 [Candidatus Acidoferrum sp.]|nr:hypothetical protein [Candidatus Acidoferrum sp.]